MLDNQQVDAMTIADQCLQMPIQDRINLIRCLEISIADERRRERECRPEMLKRWMADILGVESIPTRDRSSTYTWARWMIAYQLIEEGMSVQEVSRCMGKDHSTITHSRHQMENALAHPQMYGDVVNIWKQFKERIENETN